MGQLFPYSFAPLSAKGFVGEAVATDAITTLTVPAGASGVLLQATGGNISWTDDAVDPTGEPGGGMLLIADAEPTWFGNADLSTFQFIAVGSDTFLLASFYG